MYVLLAPLVLLSFNLEIGQNKLVQSQNFFNPNIYENEFCTENNTSLKLLRAVRKLKKILT